MAPTRLQRAEVEFRKQFVSEQEFNQILQNEVHGSKQLMREKIRRSLLIEDMLKTEVREKAKVSEGAALASILNARHPAPVAARGILEAVVGVLVDVTFVRDLRVGQRLVVRRPSRVDALVKLAELGVDRRLDLGGILR